MSDETTPVAGVAHQSQNNIYLSGPVLPLFAKTAAPIVLVMLVNGLFTVVDAYFLGVYVGADAVVAVTLMFPLYMMLIALSTLVSNGFSSVYARSLGAGDHIEAQQVFSSALQLSLLVCIGLIAGFWLLGPSLALWIANGAQGLADLGHAYLSILIYTAVLAFFLGINVDALRAEGLLPAMAAITLLSALLNICFDWLFVVQLGWGVEGSAWGTVLGQACAATALLIYRVNHSGGIHWPSLAPIPTYWRDLLALGAPSSLGYVGLSLSTGITLISLQFWAGDRFEATSGAFGIMTRLMTFIFLPLLGMSMAFQTIVSNNFGAQRSDRTRAAIRVTLAVAFFYCVGMQAIFTLSAPVLGGVFVDDANIQSELARILPIGTLTLFLFGPLMIIATYFQAIGDAARAAVLSLSRTYVFAIPLIVALPYLIGEPGIWYAGVVAEFLVLALTVLVLMRLKSGRA